MTSYSRTLVSIAAIIIILAGIKLSNEIVVPFLLSLFIAIICSPMIKFMIKRKVPLSLAIAILFIVFMLGFSFLAGVINSTLQEFTTSIPQYKVQLSARIQSLMTIANQWNLPITVTQEEIMSKLDPSSIMNLVSQLLKGLSGALSNIFVIFLIVIFMLFEMPVAKYKLALVLSADDDLRNEKEYINQVLDGVIGYLGVKTFVSLITGLLVWILLECLGVQYAILWAILSFLLNYVPNIGSILAGIPIVIQALILNGFSVGLGVLLGIIAINMAIGNALEPRLMGKKLGLSTLVVFLSLLFWGWLLGTVGMLLSVPLTMACKVALESNKNTRKYAVLFSDLEEVPKDQKHHEN
ncbi:AI-2E family transporter [Mannheimia sp. AT1]|uniref:AI-2E family transporter n=1 Tax=Mannheimia cairinae TaxID=3025936 RepID=A0ABT5MQ68_9PAST|nr:AI-2E family transporter [Mannheimia cairinae]MDD0823629.1 AI-2E family transporter [Mannheimia cairinae]MDD0825439.1 AI-2E family transporter [Mannheimia cairinae]